MIGSRVKREFHARFCEGLEVKFLGSTYYAAEYSGAKWFVTYEGDANPTPVDLSLEGYLPVESRKVVEVSLEQFGERITTTDSVGLCETELCTDDGFIWNPVTSTCVPCIDGYTAVPTPEGGVCGLDTVTPEACWARDDMFWVRVIGPAHDSTLYEAGVNDLSGRSPYTIGGAPLRYESKVNSLQLYIRPDKVDPHADPNENPRVGTTGDIGFCTNPGTCDPADVECRTDPVTCVSDDPRLAWNGVDKCDCAPGYEDDPVTGGCKPKPIDLGACWIQLGGREVTVTGGFAGVTYQIKLNNDTIVSPVPHTGGASSTHTDSTQITSVEAYLDDIMVGSTTQIGFCNPDAGCPGDLIWIQEPQRCGCPPGRIIGPDFTCVCENDRIMVGGVCEHEPLSSLGLPACWNAPNNAWICISGGVPGIQYSVYRDTQPLLMRHYGATTTCINNLQNGNARWYIEHDEDRIEVTQPPTGSDTCSTNTKTECRTLPGGGPRHFVKNAPGDLAVNFDCACDFGYQRGSNNSCTLIPITNPEACSTGNTNEIVLKIPPPVPSYILASAPNRPNGGTYMIPYRACDSSGTNCVRFFAGEYQLLRFPGAITGQVTITLDRMPTANNFPISNSPTTFNVGSLEAGSVTLSGSWEWTSATTGYCGP